MGDAAILGLSLVAAGVTFVVSVVATVNADTPANVAGAGFGFVFAVLVSALSFMAARRSAKQQKQIAELVDALKVLELERGIPFSSGLADNMRKKLHDDATRKFVCRFRKREDLVQLAIKQSECKKDNATLSYYVAIHRICEWAKFMPKQHKSYFVGQLRDLHKEMKADDRNTHDEALKQIENFSNGNVVEEEDPFASIL